MIAGTLVSVPNLTSAIELYWLGMVHVQNIIEDIQGADGRFGYLFGLRFKLVEVAQEMDDLLGASRPAATSQERWIAASDRGLPNLGINREMLMQSLAMDDVELSFDALQMQMLAFAERLIAMLPGVLPDAQGPQGQRHVLKAMQRWNAAAMACGEDVAFLQGRLQEL